MAALPLPKYGLDKLYLFPYYQTREQYRAATGQEPPPFDPTRPPQYWCDPDVLKASSRAVVYDRVLATNGKAQPLAGPDGKPYFQVLMMLKTEAATVNIPLKESANEEGTDVEEVPVPVRALEPDEELFFDFGGIVMVRNVNIVDTSVTGFTTQDREILRSIARKLNVSL